jgi:hypothetical protein
LKVNPSYNFCRSRQNSGTGPEFCFVTFRNYLSYNCYMTKNPLINALLALAYIAAVSSTLFYAPMIFKLPAQDTVFMPIMVLSLFVFSASIMGYLFLYQPILLILSNEKKEGTILFVKTAGIFGVAAIVFVVAGIFITSML